MITKKQSRKEDYEFLYKYILEVYDKNIDGLVNCPAEYKEEGISEEGEEACFISYPIVEEVVNRFIMERDIIEDFHEGIEDIDIFKKAGFLCYWICKLKPIQFLKKNIEKPEHYLNEYLAITLVMGFLYHDFNELNPNGIYIPDQLIQNLRYTLRYRTITGRMLSLLFAFYCSSYKTE